MLHPTCCAHTAQLLIPGISMLHAQLASTAQPNVLHTVQQSYNHDAIYIALTMANTMHYNATVQLLTMQCTTAQSLVLVAGVEPAPAA